MSVFVSYCHEKKINEKVDDLVFRLIRDGVECNYDQQQYNVLKGWLMWVENQITSAKNVLLVCTPGIRGATSEDKRISKGIQFELNLIYNEFYQNNSQNDKYIPIVFNESDIEYIPNPLKSSSYYNIENEEDYELLGGEPLILETIEFETE